MQEVILVVPCYNEAERFDSGVFADLLAEQPGYALLFVDDGRSDRTPERLEALRKRQPGQVSVLRLEANSGKGEAVRRGMQTALAAGAPFTARRGGQSSAAWSRWSPSLERSAPAGCP